MNTGTCTLDIESVEHLLDSDGAYRIRIHRSSYMFVDRELVMDSDSLRLCCWTRWDSDSVLVDSFQSYF